VIRQLRQAYNLSNDTIVDNKLIDALTKDMYRGLSGFNLNNPVD